MKIVLIRERKSPPDSRVALTPNQCAALVQKYPELEIGFEPSPERCFKDEEYLQAGIFPLNPENGDILLGVKEIPPTFLLPGKTYFFFSHTIKEQPHNREMFRDILRKKIRLIDYECLSRPEGGRILGFGHWAGIVGAYNALLVWGKKYRQYELKPAWQCHDYESLKSELNKIKIGAVKIAVTGEGRVAQGVLELLNLIGIQEISPAELSNPHPEAVFVHFNYKKLYQHRQGLSFNLKHFYSNHAEYQCILSRHLDEIDILINGMYWEKDMDILFQTIDTIRPDFHIKVIADISCDIKGGVPITVKDTKISDPVYGYDPLTGEIVPPFGRNSIDIMAVSNLPAELPRNASETFGNMMANSVIPELLNTDKSQIIRNATITESGCVSELFSYLKDYGALD